MEGNGYDAVIDCVFTENNDDALFFFLIETATTETYTVDDAVNQEGSHDPFRHLLRHKGSDGCKPAFNHPYGRFGPGKDCLKHDEKQRGKNDWPGDRMQDDRVYS